MPPAEPSEYSEQPRHRTRTNLLDTGVFASLDNQIDTQTGTVRAKARFDNAREQLFPSQFVNVALRVRVIQDAVVLPVTAVRQGGQGDCLRAAAGPHGQDPPGRARAVL